MERRSSRDDDRDSRGRGRDDEPRARRGRDDDEPRSRRSREDDDDRAPRERESRDDGAGRRGGGRFEFRERDASAVRKRQEGSSGDQLFSDNIKSYKPVKGDNRIRILPPTWDKAEHYGLDLWVHYGIGPDNTAYACLDKMKREPCPICEERRKAMEAGDTDYADDLKPTRRVMAYVVDRNKPKDGIQLWPMSWTTDRDISKLMTDKETGEIIYLDNPTEGYDVLFDRDGEGMRTKYLSIQLARRSTPLDDDDALEYAKEHPLDTVVNYFDYDTIKRTFGGQVRRSEKDDDRKDKGDSRDRDRDRDDPPKRSSRDDDRPSRSRREEEDPPPKKPKEKATWKEIHAMTWDDMCDYVDEQGIRIDPKTAKDEDDLADWICESQGIEKESARRPSRDDDDDRPKARTMRDDTRDSVRDKVDEVRRKRVED